MKDYEDEAFDDIERAQGWRKRQIEDQISGGQPYHFDVFVSVSQRNQVLEEAAKLAEVWELPLFAEEIRSLKQ